MTAPKNGFFYVLDQTMSELISRWEVHPGWTGPVMLIRNRKDEVLTENGSIVERQTEVGCCPISEASPCLHARCSFRSGNRAWFLYSRARWCRQNPRYIWRFRWLPMLATRTPVSRQRCTGSWRMCRIRSRVRRTRWCSRVCWHGIPITESIGEAKFGWRSRWRQWRVTEQVPGTRTGYFNVHDAKTGENRNLFSPAFNAMAATTYEID